MPMDEEQYLRIWNALTSELDPNRDISKLQPLLAHYTSMAVVESILKDQRIWLSNPLNMNDHQEVRFGINAAIGELHRNQKLKEALKKGTVYERFLSEIGGLYQDYGLSEVKNLFVACFSRHDAADIPDGVLSMWRGYGDFGGGAAIVFDTSTIRFTGTRPFLVAEVIYRSDKDRIQMIADKVDEIAGIAEDERINEGSVSGFAHLVFRRAVLAAIFTKHIGFKEEREWRVVYMPTQDKDAAFGTLCDYHHGPLGLEPKMKLPFNTTDGTPCLGVDLETAVHSIIVGPRASSPLNLHAAEMMLRKIGQDRMIARLKTSSIPFRN